MPKFEDFLDAFNYSPDTFNADQFKAAVKAAHDEDTGAITAAAAAKDAEIAARDERITKLGADNWNLLMKQGPKVDDVQQTQTPSGDDGEPKPKSIDSMFKKVDRKV